jgi:hypothetical protein
MGGHGVWQIGAHFPDRFLAIGPSAGWISMMSYAGARRSENPSPVTELLLRAASPSDTLALRRNYTQHGVYILHGEKDDNVPVGQARTMKQSLQEFHHNFAYHEEPGMGHWWGKEGIPGTACVDWPPMWQFFRQHTIKSEAPREFEFVTASPGISSNCRWVSIEAQLEQLKLSSVKLSHDPGARSFTGTTQNVARIALDLRHLSPGQPIRVELDGQTIEPIAWPRIQDESPAGDTTGSGVSTKPQLDRIWLKRDGTKWSTTDRPPASTKGPQRYGTFKDGFRNHVLFVYSTRGTPQENAWSQAKARYDAETFWYRGNGSIDVWKDTDFEAECTRVAQMNPDVRAALGDRNIIVYGHADSNAAWTRLLSSSPVQVRRGRIEFGERVESGDDLACLFVRPRPGSDTATVGVVSGTSVAGMRLSDRLPYFVSGVAYPDCVVLDSRVLSKGAEGLRVAGYFGLDWQLATGEFAWHD